MNSKPKIAITHGDINGISYEILLKLLATPEITKLFTPIVYGSAKVAAYYRKVLNIETEPWTRINSPEEAFEGKVNLIQCISDDVVVSMGKVTPEAGKASFDALETAMKDILEGKTDALVTAPIHKASMSQELFPFTGHTAYLAHKCHLSEQKSPLMILMANGIRVALVTEHIPISSIASTISIELIISKLQRLQESLIRDFTLDNPRIAVLALNPHAGDNGLIGSEEQTTILPAIRHCREELGICCVGPYPADGFWGSSLMQRFDGILAMYHDQGLAPFKTMFMECGVNFTAGLPIVRTSPDHGTGYDIVGKGIADESSLRQAVYTAIDIVKNREKHDSATRNPLRKLYFSSNKDNEELAPIPFTDD